MKKSEVADAGERPNVNNPKVTLHTLAIPKETPEDSVDTLVLKEELIASERASTLNQHSSSGSKTVTPSVKYSVEYVPKESDLAALFKTN